MAEQVASEQERFLAAVYQGSDLLGKGALIEAQEALREALEVRPDDAKARNLLGLACFKQGDYKEAEELYQSLVHENPTDPTLRVNLGLVYLKCGRFEEAIRELSISTDMEPGHKRAQNYLGLAHARVGDYAQARECFALAGSEAMVEQMDEALSGGAAPTLPGLGAGHQSAAGTDRTESGEGESTVEAMDPALEPVIEIEDEDPPAAALPNAGDPSQGDASPDPFGAVDEVEEVGEVEEVVAEIEGEGSSTEKEAFEAEAAPRAEAASAQPVAAAPVPSGQVSFAQRAAASSSEPVLRLGQEPRTFSSSRTEGCFGLAGRSLRVAVKGEVVTRARGLVAADGALTFTPEMKRFRGRSTEKPFGEGEERVFRVSGEGALLIGLSNQSFQPLILDGVDGYLEESRVFAFEASIAFENGRVPSTVSADLNLVHLRGRGVVIARIEGPLHTVAVHAGAPVRVPKAHLVGWHGALTPHFAVMAEEGGPEGESLVGIELSGEGEVLVSLPRWDGRPESA